MEVAAALAYIEACDFLRSGRCVSLHPLREGEPLRVVPGPSRLADRAQVHSLDLHELVAAVRVAAVQLSGDLVQLDLVRLVYGRVYVLLVRLAPHLHARGHRARAEALPRYLICAL